MIHSRNLRHAFTFSRLTACFIFASALALYIRTAAPTLGGAFDSEEFQHVAYNLDVAHATGYPLYILLGKLFTTFVPIGNIAYRMNLLSAFISAAAAVLVYLNALALTRRRIASIATAALFATNPAVWRQAGVASVGPLHLFLISAIMYAMLLWHEKRAPLSIAAFLFGLGLAHHRTTLLFALPIAILVLLVDPGILRRSREIVKNFFWLALPLLLYLVLPIFGGNSPWYSNTLQGFFSEISGGDAGAFIRATPAQILEGIALTSQYLLDSFGYLGLAFVIIGTMQVIHKSQFAIRNSLFLGIATIIFSVWGALYAGEPDRYLVLPFAFLIYWFALGVGAIEERMKAESTLRGMKKPSSFILHPSSFAILLALLIALPFADRFRTADWSTFDRVYKQWDEIFSLPIPQNATLVGNWGQLNAMRYMQRIEHRRPDLQFVGTLYDVTPQTQAAENALANGRAIFLAPGVAQPSGTYRYALLGPLLEVRDKPQMHAPATARNIAINPSLTLADFAITTALEPYAPMTDIAPGRTARVALTWRAESVLKDFIVRLQLYDPDARLISQTDEPPVRGLYPTVQWQPGEYINDVHNFLIPAGSPPGKYQLKLQVIDAASKQPTGAEIALITFDIDRATNITRDQVFIAHPLDIAFEPNIDLWGYGGYAGTYRANERISGSLVWHARQDIGADNVITFALLNSGNELVAEWTNNLVSFYPTSYWKKGETLKGYYDFFVPANLPAGEYTFGVGFDPHQLANISKIQIAP